MLREMPRRVPAPPRITRSNWHDRSSARVGASLAEGHARSPHRAPDPLAPEGEAGNPSPHNEGSMSRLLRSGGICHPDRSHPGARFSVMADHGTTSRFFWFPAPVGSAEHLSPTLSH